jgi:hypothetical protein
MKQAELIENWLQALESGKYRQGKSVLVQDTGSKPKYCCLGVACKVANDLGVRNFDITRLDEDGEQALNDSFARKLGINSLGEFKVDIEHRNQVYSSLADLNDGGVKFKTIAKIIREQIAAKNFRKVGR